MVTGGKREERRTVSERDKHEWKEVEFIIYIIEQIFDYAKANGLDPDETLGEIAYIIKGITE